MSPGQEVFEGSSSLCCGNSDDTDAPVDPAKGDSLDAIFLSCPLVFLETFPTPANEVAIMPPAYSPSIGNIKFPNKEMSLKVPIFLGALLRSIHN